MTELQAEISSNAWHDLLSRLSLRDAGGTHAALVAAYSGRARHYHTLPHIADCLTHLEENADLAENSDVLALALWFHDAVYNWRSARNEAESAAWARRFLDGQAGADDLGEAVERLIMATCHGSGVAEHSGDAALMVDIDLSILGRPPDVYNAFETNIRKEYRLVPGPIYRRKRREVLHWFLDRERIYATDVFEERYGPQARENLTRAIAMLS